MSDNIQYNRIKAVLAERNRTAKWLASEMKLSVVTISRWSTNLAQPSIPQLFTIADLLGISPSELLVK